MRRVYEFLLILLIGGFVYIAIESAANKIIIYELNESEENN